ncbi:MAG: ASPIC/UnbV domain-containing protein [Flavobacteriales bacterium]|nr:ASPIC/UnbV domain-containing protein [Flavobacteriales bacterium]
MRAGESYGMVTTFAGMFGLGSHTTIPTLTIRWPSGLTETFNDIDADQYITVIENTCISPEATITPIGNPVLCGNGDSVVLEANDGFTYTWSNGAPAHSPFS